MSKIIVGIHGLANKPEERVLTDWWTKSITEGLKKNREMADVDFDFEMVYWADLLYKNPQHRDPSFDFDSLYNSEPYKAAAKAPKRYVDGWLDDVRGSVLGAAGTTIDFLKEQSVDHFQVRDLRQSHARIRP